MADTITTYPCVSTFADGSEFGDEHGYVRHPGSLMVTDWHRIQLAAIAGLSADELQGWADLVTGGRDGVPRDLFPGEMDALMTRASELGVTIG